MLRVAFILMMQVQTPVFHPIVNFRDTVNLIRPEVNVQDGNYDSNSFEALKAISEETKGLITIDLVTEPNSRKANEFHVLLDTFATRPPDRNFSFGNSLKSLPIDTNKLVMYVSATFGPPTRRDPEYWGILVAIAVSPIFMDYPYRAHPHNYARQHEPDRYIRKCTLTFLLIDPKDGSIKSVYRKDWRNTTFDNSNALPSGEFNEHIAKALSPLTNPLKRMIKR